MTIENLKILIADEDKWLTKGGVYSKKVYLGTLDKAENWTEITEAEYQQAMAEQEQQQEPTTSDQ